MPDLSPQTELFALEPEHKAGARPMKLPPGLTTSAIYGGPNKCYRYVLKHVWNASLPQAVWIMMNPSAATERTDDRTLSRTRGFSRDWGYGGVVILNTMAYRATDQKDLLTQDDPVGPDNDHHILEEARKAGIVIVAYGTPRTKALQGHGPRIVEMIRKEGIEVNCIEVSGSGRPIHPLYLPAILCPRPLPGNG